MAEASSYKSMIVPADFAEEVDSVVTNKRAGDLALLSNEVKGFEWEVNGWRTVGRAQLKLDAFASAKVTWEAIREREPLDNEAKVVLEEISQRVEGIPRYSQDQQRKRVLIFAGHMIDAPGRKKPRFPADKESVAREKIKEAIVREMNKGAGVACGYAGAASGGDMLFQEICAELNIPTRLYLAIPPQQYLKTSVSQAGAEWVDRFSTVYDEHTARNQVRILSDATDVKDEVEYLPAWLRAKPDYSIWQRNNLWMLFNALDEGCDPKSGDPNITLIALWDGEGGDGPGGTGDLVNKVENLGARCEVIKTKELFGL